MNRGAEIVKQKCDAYMAKTGCGWTNEHACPGQPHTRDYKDDADDDGSIGYKCCCVHKMWDSSATDGESLGGSQQLSEEHLSKPVTKKPVKDHAESRGQRKKQMSGSHDEERGGNIDMAITEEIEQHHHEKAVKRIEQKIKNFETHIDRMLGVKKKEIPLDGTSPLLVQIPGAEPMWIRANWKNPIVKDSPPKTEEPVNLSAELEDPDATTEHSAAPLLPIALFSTAVMPGSPLFRRQVRSSQSVWRSQRCSSTEAEAFLWPKAPEALLAK